MAIQFTTLRPGLLVSLKTTVSGNVSYRKQTIEGDHLDAEGVQRARWETERAIADPTEHERAIKARSKARTIIMAVCTTSSFGLLCPEANADKLEAALTEARRITDEFNETANLSRVSVYAITGRIAPDDVEAVRAINSEVRELMERMADGLKRLDVQTVRDAANKARGLGQMLSPDAASRIKVAIDTARSAARKIVKAGETAAQEIDQAALQKIASARTAFLDLDTPAAEIESPAIATGREIDLAPEQTPVAAPKAAAPAFEF